LGRLPGHLEPPVEPAAAPATVAADGRGQPVLEARNLNKHFGGLHATNDVSLTLHEGEILGVIGPNGAGKTTVFNQLSGFINPDSGSVRVRTADGNWVEPKSSRDSPSAGVGRTFPIAQPFSCLSVLEIVVRGAVMQTGNRREAEAIARQVADLTERAGSLDAEARSLTIGGLKRLEVARAFATRPRILLLDEVMAGLNPPDVERAIRIVRRTRRAGAAGLVTQHSRR